MNREFTSVRYTLPFPNSLATMPFLVGLKDLFMFSLTALDRKRRNASNTKGAGSMFLYWFAMAPFRALSLDEA